MIQGKKIIGLIAARGGSKEYQKNIKPLLGSPLIYWTINEAKKSKYIDRLILSSDNEEIISVAKDCGLEVPFIRPAELAKDETIPVDVFIHAIEHALVMILSLFYNQHLLYVLLMILIRQY